MTDEFFLGAPPVVSKRNHFRSLGLLVDEWFFRFDTREWPEEKTAKFKNALLGLAEAVVHEMQWAFKTAAERGIEQAATLIADPDFFQSTKKRLEAERKTYLKNAREDQQKRQAEEMAPSTPQQINYKISTLKRMVEYHKEQQEKYARELAEFQKDPARTLDLAKVDPKARTM